MGIFLEHHVEERTLVGRPGKATKYIGPAPNPCGSFAALQRVPGKLSAVYR